MNIFKLEQNIFQIKSLMPPDECNSLIALSERLVFKKADVQTDTGRQLLTNIRNNERVDHESPELANQIWQRIAKLPLPSFENRNAVGISPYFRFYKYLPQQKFNMHKDGRQWIGDHETLFTLLIYLNEDCTGGETLFRQGNLKVTPEKGLAIIFEHRLWHQGVQVTEGVKYVLRSDMVYGKPEVR